MMTTQLYKLTKSQERVLNEWLRTKNAVIQIPTGSGKSIIGLDILSRDEFKTILVVANTNIIVNQWKNDIEKMKLNKYILIETIQTAYKFIDKEFDLLIADEAHHSPAEAWVRLLENNYFKNKLFLTATLNRSDQRHLILTKGFEIPIISSLSYEDGKRENLISDFEIIRRAVKLESIEQQKLTKITNYIEENFPNFYNNFLYVKQRMFNDFRAGELMRCFRMRKKILNNAFNKRFEVLKILREENFNKCLIFTEFITEAEALSEFLTISGGIKNNVYHSKTKNREQIIEDFKNNEFDVLISVKALDEGFNVPEADLGIETAATQQKRQAIQRLGRILRYREGKKARMYFLYVAGSKEEIWVKKRISTLK